MKEEKRFCRNCQEEMYVLTEVMPEDFPHYAKRSCAECGKFIDWMRKPKDPQSKKEAARVIELKKQTLELLFSEFREKYKKLVIEIYELEVEFDYITHYDFWKDE